MKNSGAFDFFESVYMPVAVCTKSGRLVYRNSFADRLGVLPKNGMSVESVAEREDAANAAEQVRFRRLRRQTEHFGTALVFPIYLPSGEEYCGWLFDVTFQHLDDARSQLVLAAFRDYTVRAGGTREVTGVVNAVTFRRFCEYLLTALLSTVPGHRNANLHYVSRTLLYSVRGALEKFGCRVDITLPDKVPPLLMTDYSALVHSTVHALIFALSHSVRHDLSVSMELNGEDLETFIEVDVGKSGRASGDFEELEHFFPESRVFIGIMSAAFRSRENGFRFTCADGRLKISFSQRTVAAEKAALHQRASYTEEICVILSHFLRFAGLLVNINV